MSILQIAFRGQKVLPGFPKTRTCPVSRDFYIVIILEEGVVLFEVKSFQPKTNSSTEDCASFAKSTSAIHNTLLTTPSDR